MFITGEPHHSIIHPDYVPSVFPSAYGNQARLGQGQRKGRFDRLRKRYEKQAQREADVEAARLQAEEEARTREEEARAQEEETARIQAQEAAEALLQFSQMEVIKDQGTQTEAVNMIDCSQQTEKDLPGMVESLQKKEQGTAGEDVWHQRDRRQ